ncbi:hypothetical protein [Rhizobium sp.]|uniref:hypothetical protein n=1 Tax=Rhizobium sp. TaxID=391 RepID=UPI0034C62D7B
MLIHIGRHWEEEIAVSMIMFYQILPIDKWVIAQCSNAYTAWLLKFSAQKTLLLRVSRSLILSVRLNSAKEWREIPRFVTLRLAS